MCSWFPPRIISLTPQQIPQPSSISRNSPFWMREMASLLFSHCFKYNSGETMKYVIVWHKGNYKWGYTASMNEEQQQRWQRWCTKHAPWISQLKSSFVLISDLKSYYLFYSLKKQIIPENTKYIILPRTKQKQKQKQFYFFIHNHTEQDNKRSKWYQIEQG